MSSTIDVSRIHSRPEGMTSIEREISRITVRADLRRLGCRPMQQLLTYYIENDPTFHEAVPGIVTEMVIQDPGAFLQSFTVDQSLGQRIAQNRRQKMTFADIIKDLVQPDILEENTRQMENTQSLLLNVTEEHQGVFETEIVENANRWIQSKRENFRQLAMSDQIIRKWVEVLEPAAAQGYSMDPENDVVMNAAPPLPFIIEPPSHYTVEVAPCMINETYQPWLNKVGRQFIAQ